MDPPRIYPGSSFSSSLQCPICVEYFAVPIHQCDSGHSICNSCSARTSKCPSCRANISRKLRNYHLEQQLLTIEYNCKFEGCGLNMQLAVRLEHEAQCPFNPTLTCLLQNCKWSGSKKALAGHLGNKHKIPHYDICGNTAEYSSRLRSSSLPSTAGCVKLLHTFFLPNNHTATVLTYIFMDAVKNLFYPQFRTLGECPVKYSLKIWNTESDDSDEIVIVGKALTVKSGLDEEREGKKGLALDLESLINKFAFKDSLDEEHRLLHYRLTVEWIGESI